MFQLYKTRNFNALINDTFGLLKHSGKNYFRNYFAINGGLLLVLAVLAFIFGKVFFENLFSGVANAGSPEMIEGYFAENFGLMLFLGITTMILILLVLIVNYCYPVAYMMALETTDKPDTKQLFTIIKARFGKAILFGLCSLVTFVPLAALVGVFCVLMFVIIIGVPVAIIVIAAFTCWIYLSFYDYISTDNSYLDSMGAGWNMLFKNFWAHTGTTAIFYIILYILQLALLFVTIILTSLTGLFSTGVDNVDADPMNVATTVSVAMVIGFVIQSIVAFVMGNFILINQGMIYYSCREEQENKSVFEDIDQIGKDFE